MVARIPSSTNRVACGFVVGVPLGSGSRSSGGSVSGMSDTNCHYIVFPE